MEKVMYALWRDPVEPVAAFAARLLAPTVTALVDAGARGVQVNVADDAVASAVVRLAELQPQMEAVVSVWLDTAIDRARQPIDAILCDASSRLAGYLVVESMPLPNVSRPAALGTRTDGFANLAFLRRPARLGVNEWLDAWQNRHTPVAIATQSTFGYTQNVVVRALLAESPAIDGIVEELFPPEALTDVHAFFDAVGDDAKLTANMTAMGESTERFGASEAIDVVPTSQYVFASPFA
jgi:hypothetical protein